MRRSTISSESVAASSSSVGTGKITRQIPGGPSSGILKSATISFGQALVPEVIDRAMQAAAEADLFLSVGTSLQVYPIAGAVPVAKRAGARLVIVNAEPTPFDELADAVFNDSISAVLPKLIA